MDTFESKLAELNRLQSQVTSLSQLIDAKANQLALRESHLRQGQRPNNSAQNLEYNLRQNLGPLLAPGNIGDINNIIWPFYFTTEIPDESIGANETFQTGFSVTQEAAFIWTSFTKAVYLDDAGSWGYLNPDDTQPSAPGLSFTLRDGSSSRQLFNTPMNIDNYGNPRFPTKLPRPIMLLPNQVMQIAFANSHEANSYVPFITAFGYRVRIEQADKLLSLVYG